VASVRRLGVAPVSADHTVVSPVGQARTRIVAASDADEEVRAAVRAVVDAARSGVPLGRMAVLSGAPVPYARLVHDHLQGAGIDRNGASPMPLRERLAARILLHLLDWPAGGFRRWDLFAGLSDAPLRAGGRRLPFTGWDRLSRQAAVVAGRDDWDLLLTVLADAQEAEAIVFDADPERPPWLAQRARRDAADARRLREFAIGLIDDLAGAASTPRPWSAHAEWARGLIGRVLGPAPSRADWPAVEQKAAERLEAALVRLGALDDVEGAITLEVFTRTLRLVLDADLGRVGRLGEGVLVGSVGSGVGLDLDLVVVVGLAEGAYPTRSGEDPLLDDRARAATSGLLRTRRDGIDGQHRQLLAALAGARRQVLTVPRGDLRRSTERVPSRWVLAIASELAGHRCWARDLFTADEAWVDNVPSFEAGLRATAFPATEQEHHLTRMMATGGAPNGSQDDTLARGVEVLTSRRSTRFTRFDGNLSAVTVRSPTGQPTSATRLEQWAVCPWSHLLANHLGVQPVEEPEDRLEISPLDRGNLIHEVFETFFGEVLHRPLEDQPGPDDPWTQADHARLLAIGEDVCAAYETRGLTGKRILWQRDRAIIVTDLDRALTYDDERRRQHRARPVAAELAFGTRDAELGPVELGLPDGRTVAFRGRIDRIDRLDDGGLLVIDYKTGRSDRQPKLTEATPVDSGRKLQLPVYAAAARARHGGPDVAVRSEYWFATRRGRFKTFGYQVTPEAMGATAQTLGLIVSGIEAGTFPNHPTASSTNIRKECPYCDPDGLGVVELRRQWERKAADPTLAGYVGLVEPGLLLGGAGS
ncbi:MAG: PD-(D/E)XK nuclease family protein, partial [Actinomycetota bacterium]|nr:PD-(D/E)XK nuclease family protein [Actinomycetota bacterium]